MKQSSDGRSTALACAIVFLLAGCVHKGHTVIGADDVSISQQEMGALALVEQRTLAYNAHDIDAFIATYHPRVRIYEYPDHFLGEGIERMRVIFGPQFEAGEGNIRVLRRFALEGWVISDEIVTIGDHTEKNIGIYTIVGDQITEVRLIEPTT